MFVAKMMQTNQTLESQFCGLQISSVKSSANHSRHVKFE
jgi:hypothetical protein